ncbi:beta-mannosidase [Polaribacter pacificus]|uniref:Beta-mannosidase B n=1 Tax=Polaribacter pacificus TaxID=1775173 RepID=A0A917MEU5_9FLAO|nr:glycoside hydrolase family 2 protein [Polaribacter pacificus]GGH00213.1 beta-mannosidase [Polaribacter pacificus]
MNRKLLLLSFLALSVFSCKKLQQELPTNISLSENWVFKATDETSWKPAEVPGNVFTDLLKQNLIPDPFIKTNEDSVQWVSSKKWEYKKLFEVPKNILDKAQIELSFEGLDTYATVYLNDVKILTSNNAFRTYTVNVKSNLKNSNQLRVVFDNSQEQLKEKQNPYQLPEGSRIYTRKAQFQSGWDWGPKLNTAGIWKDVKLKAWNTVRFEDVFIKQDQLSKSLARLTAEISIHSTEDKNVSIFSLIDKQETSHELQIKKGTHTYKIPLEINNPELWWTHNLGAQKLYQFQFQLIADGTLSDVKNLKKGLRTIELVRKKDAIGESFAFHLNGVPVFMKGANYIPQNSFQNKVRDQHYKKLLSNAVDANMNMLRVWGGGIYENDIFYELCDEKGLLIWQDFMFACAMYPGDEDFLDNVQQEAIDQVKRLRNHSSIALWCGNNENAEGWNRWGWQTGRSEQEKEEIWKDYQKVFNDILPTTVSQLTDATSYWESSPKYGRGNPKHQFEGDAHDWWVWHDAYPFEHFTENVPRFMSEFGFQSLPSYQTINHINQTENVQLDTEAMKSHQKHVRGTQLIQEYLLRDYQMPKTDKDYVYISQLLQAKGIVMAIEAQRRAMPNTMGSLFWQLNDCWPAISWSSIDYFGNWKALQHKAKKAFKDLLISNKLTETNLDTYLINDHLEAFSGTLKLRLLGFDGAEIWSDEQLVSIAENTSKIVYKKALNTLDFDKKSTVLLSSFEGESSIFYFEKPKNLALQNKPISKEIIRKTATGFSIVLKSTTLQKDVFLWSSNQGHFSDNFFDLLPNEPVTIVFKTDATALEDLEIKSLNSIY